MQATKEETVMFMDNYMETRTVLTKAKGRPEATPLRVNRCNDLAVGLSLYNRTMDFLVVVDGYDC